MHLSEKRQEEKGGQEEDKKKMTITNVSLSVPLVNLSNSELSHPQDRIITTKSGVMSFSEDMSAFSPNLLYPLRREDSLDIHSHT